MDKNEDINYELQLIIKRLDELEHKIANLEFQFSLLYKEITKESPYTQIYSYITHY